MHLALNHWLINVPRDMVYALTPPWILPTKGDSHRLGITKVVGGLWGSFTRVYGTNAATLRHGRGSTLPSLPVAGNLSSTSPSGGLAPRFFSEGNLQVLRRCRPLLLWHLVSLLVYLYTSRERSAAPSYLAMTGLINPDPRVRRRRGWYFGASSSAAWAPAKQTAGEGY